MKKRAAIYIRLSSEEQAKEGYSPQTQREKCLEFAERNGFEVNEKHIFADLGYSGGTEKRPGLQKLLESARKREFDAVIVYRLDRFFRNLRLLINTAYELRNLGIGLISVCEPFDTSTPTGRAMLYSLGTFAEWQREVTLEARNEGAVKAVKEGKWIGSGLPPFGYDFDPKTHGLKVNEKEAEIVKMMFDWLINEGLTVYQIQKRLNEMKIPTKFDRAGRKKKLKSYCWWHVGVIYRILKREMYTGIYWWRKYKKPNNSHNKIENLRPKKDWILIKVPAIISRETFEKAQEILSRNKQLSPRNTKRLYLFQHKLICGFDGRKFSSNFRKPRNQNQRGTIYYVCPNRYSTNSPQKCRSPMIAESRLEVVWENLKSILTNPERAFEYLKEYLRQRETFNVEEKLKSIDKKLLSLKSKEERLAELYSEGIIDIDIYKKQWEKCKTEEEKLLRERELLLQSVANENGKSEILDSLKALYNSLKESLENATREIKYGIIQRLVEKIVVRGENLEVVYNIPLKVKDPENCALCYHNKGFTCENKKLRFTVKLKLLSRSKIAKMAWEKRRKLVRVSKLKTGYYP